jgi:hypothetical protein
MSINSPIKYKQNDYFYSINDPEYQGQLERLVLSNFKDSVHGSKYLKQLNNASYDTNCVRGDLKLQNQQNLVASYINSTTPHRGLILWHGIGSGKTLSSILISKKTMDINKKIIGIIPAMLVDNFREELIGTKLKRKSSLILDNKTLIKYNKYNPELLKLQTDISTNNASINGIQEQIKKNQEELKDLASRRRTKTETRRIQHAIQTAINKINRLEDINENDLKLKIKNITQKRKTIREIEELIPDEDYDKFYFSTSNGILNTFEPKDISKFENNLLILDESQIIISKINNGFTKLEESRRVEPARQTRVVTAIQGIQQGLHNAPNIHQQASNALTMLHQRNSYVDFYQGICSLNNIKIVCLSGTPIISDVRELAILFNLLYGSKKYFNIDTTINNNINGNILINIITNKNIGALNTYLDSQTIQNPTKILYNEFIKHIDFSKSTVQQPLVSIFINPERYENQFDQNTHGYIGMKYVPTTTVFSIEQFLTTLNIQHTVPPPLYLFDIENFNTEHSLNINILPQFNETQRNGYKLSESNDQRLQNLDKILNLAPGVDSINNQALFIEKTRGLLSYFGNIDNLMPNLNIYDSDKLQTPPVQYNIKSNDSIRCKIGYNNNGQPLYNIKICNMIILNTQRTLQYGYINSIRTPRPIPNSDSDFIITLGMSRLKNNVEHFIYPLLDYNKQIHYYSAVFNTCFRQYIDNYNTNPANTNKINITTELNDIKKYKTGGITPANLKTKEFIDRFLIKDLRYLNQYNIDNYSKGPIHALNQYLDDESHIRNIWNYSDFNKSSSKDEFHISRLIEHSVKFYYIIRCIMENPDDLHVVYIEYRQIIIPFVRALQANGYSEFINDNTIAGGGIKNKLIESTKKRKTKQIITPIDRNNKYMFLTGSGGETGGQDDRFLDHLDNKQEGQTIKNKKQEYIDIFNSTGNINGKKIRIVILNSAAAEGITLKNVRYIHMLHPPSNMSRLFQIFGRGIRTCSHYALNDSDRNITPFLYISSYGSDYTNTNDMTKDEKNFEKIVSINDRNLPYLQILKNNAIDKVLFNAQDSALLPNPPVRSISHNRTKKRSFNSNSNGNQTRKRGRIRSK